MFYEENKIYFPMLTTLLTTLNLFQNYIRANYFLGGMLGKIKIEGFLTQASLVFGPVLSGPSEAASL